MNQKDLHRYRITLLKLRDRLTETVLRMTEIVPTDAQPMGEHDRHVSASPDAELTLEQDVENIRRLVVHALKRVEKGTFGICQKCGTPIGLQRLDAVPYAPNCIKCERTLENAA